MTATVVAGRSVVDVVRSGGVRSIYQPIVDLETGSTVAFEALARGPRQHVLERPDLLFAAAREQDCVGELDAACRRAALDGALSGGLRPPWTLFVNVEPSGMDWSWMRGLDLADDCGQDFPAALPVVVEITERDLTGDPTSLLRFVEHVRSAGCGIALDDVGAQRESLALMPLLRPDVIKLDLRLVQQRPTGEIAEIVTAVSAEAERSGAVILAEGIETEAHREFASGLGARLGQGWLLGRPGPLPPFADIVEPTPGSIPVASRTELALADTPFSVATAGSPTRLARKPLLIEISKHLERQALLLGDSALVVSTLQHAQFFTPATAARYQRLADTTAFAAVLGEDIPAWPLPGLRGGDLAADDPLVGEWDIAVLGPHFAAALLARDLGDSGPDATRRFDYVLTHHRDTVVAIAAALISRVTPSTPAEQLRGLS